MAERFPTTGSGKGGKSRVQNFKTYQDNLEQINWNSKKSQKKNKKKS